MVATISSLGRNGVHDYILVRASGIIMAVYAFFLTGFFLITPEITYANWTALFQSIPMKLGTVLTMFALLVHAWIGTWQVLTDYVKCTILRGSLQLSCVVIAFSYVIAGIMIVWSV